MIEDKKIVPLGSYTSMNIDIRIIAATNKDLELEVEKGNFREDLFYRLNILPVRLPPLRERKEDIPLIAEFFLRKYAEKLSKPVKSISHSAMNDLLDYPWPGNIRELRNFIERAVILEKEEMITDIRALLMKRERVSVDPTTSFKENKTRVIENLEKAYFPKVLDMYSGRLKEAAKHAGMDVKNFSDKMKKYGIKRDGFLK